MLFGVLCCRESLGNDFLRFFLNSAQVSLAEKTLRVEFVHFLGARGARREPAVGRYHFEAADRTPIAGRLAQHRFDFLSRQFSGSHLFRRQTLEDGFLLSAGRGVDTLVHRVAILPCELAIKLSRIAAGACRHFRSQ